MKIHIINGPNLNLLGKREPDKYGFTSFEVFLKTLRSLYPDIQFEYFQSNIEGEIIDEIQKADIASDGIILNPAGYTHTSISIADAVAAVKVPVAEVHITNISAREEFRHVSLTGKYCSGSVIGFGLDGYRLATEAIIGIIERDKKIL
ncbi:MAG: type II 3-dehydroquinate dehydratase [Bacteroidales bacterium]